MVVKNEPEYQKRKMHVAGLQQIDCVNGHQVELRYDSALNGKTQISSGRHRELALKVHLGYHIFKEINREGNAMSIKKLLWVEASPRGQDSFSTRAAQAAVETLKKQNPGLEIQMLNVTELNAPHITYPQIGAYFTPEQNQSVDQKKLLELSNRLTDQLLSADAVLISTPMWNFTIPSQLKAWVDHISRAGKTFAFTEKGPVGLLKTKKAYIVVGSGSVFSAGPFQAYDFVVPYLKTILGFLGVQNFEVIRAEGTNDPATAANALDAAKNQAKSISS